MSASGALRPRRHGVDSPPTHGQTFSHRRVEGGALRGGAGDRVVQQRRAGGGGAPPVGVVSARGPDLRHPGGAGVPGGAPLLALGVRAGMVPGRSRPRGDAGRTRRIAERRPAARLHPARDAPAAGRYRGPVHLRRTACPRHHGAHGHPPLRLRARAGGRPGGRRRRRGARRHGRVAQGGRGDRERRPPRGRRYRGGNAAARSGDPSGPCSRAQRRRRRRAAERGLLAVKIAFRRRLQLFPWVLCVLALLAGLFVPMAVMARPGGGEGYSGGGGSDGGGGDDGGLVYLLIRLWIEFVFAYPQFGIPATIVIVAILIARQKRKAKAGPQLWDSAPPKAPAPRQTARGDLDAVRNLDPEFSVVLFEDFAYALFAKAHQARSSERDLESLSPYLGQAARSHLAQRRPVGAPVSGVVVGAMRVLDLSIPSAAAPPAGSPPPQVVVSLEFEANMTVGMAGAEHTHYVQERWRLVRDAGVQTRPAAQVRSFQCPNCGAPFGPEGGDRCEYCGQVVSGGRFDWSVESIELVRLEERPPALTSDVQEVGSNWPTIFHPALNARWAELAREDPAVTQQALDARLRLIYDELNAAWS